MTCCLTIKTLRKLGYLYLTDCLNAMTEQMVGRCVTIMGKWLHNCFYIFDLHICNSHESLLLYFYFQSLFFFCVFFYILVFLQLVYLYGYTFSEGKDHIHTLDTMIVKYPCLVCNRADTKNHKAVQCDCCDHNGIACVVLKRKCCSLLLKMNTCKNLCMANFFYLQIRK